MDEESGGGCVAIGGSGSETFLERADRCRLAIRGGTEDRELDIKGLRFYIKRTLILGTLTKSGNTSTILRLFDGTMTEDSQY